MLDNALGEARVMYTRRPRLLDEELLDGEKDISGNLPINFTSSPSSMVLSTASNQSNNQVDELFSTNKTDSEKFNEIQCKDVPVVTDILPEKASSVVKECEGKVFKNSDSVSSENDLNDNFLLRRQQLTRVAEWVQNSSNIPLPNSPEQKLGEILNDSSKLNGQINLDLENNNLLVNKQNYASLNSNQVYKESNLPLCESNAQKCFDEKLNNNSSMLCSSMSEYPAEQSGFCTRNGELDGRIDLAQMEYNVKKFLLKQNEWSINRALSVDSFAKSSDESNDETIFIKSSYQRTETNL